MMSPKLCSPKLCHKIFDFLAGHFTLVIIAYYFVQGKLILHQVTSGIGWYDKLPEDTVTSRSKSLCLLQCASEFLISRFCSRGNGVEAGGVSYQLHGFSDA